MQTKAFDRERKQSKREMNLLKSKRGKKIKFRRTSNNWNRTKQISWQHL